MRDREIERDIVRKREREREVAKSNTVPKKP